MTDNKKKGDFDQWKSGDRTGGDKKQEARHNEKSRTGSKQNAGGGHKR